VLNLRKEHPGLFSTGGYIPLEVTGERRDHVFAFARIDKQAVAVVCVPRLFTRLTPDLAQLSVGTEIWGKTAIDLSEQLRTEFTNVFTGKVFPLAGAKSRVLAAELFAEFPLALLVGQRQPASSA
jgi:(1->4)-alpha-D-glucan 1-alpha-D-glucosylmutase